MAKFEFVGEMTYGKMYNDILPTIKDREEAAEYFEACVDYTMRVGNQSREEAEEVVNINIGYIAGYFDVKEAQRIHNLFKVAHPIFGSAATWDDMTPESMIEAGMQAAKATELAPLAPADALPSDGDAAELAGIADHLASESVTLAMEIADALGVDRHTFLDADGPDAIVEAIEALRAENATAREALQRCINADLTGYWSPEEVAKRFFAAYPGNK